MPGSPAGKRRGESLEVLEFLLSNERYAIEISWIRETLPLKELTPLPCTPPFVLGLINVRGRILSVIDIRKFFDLPEKGLTDLNKVIILQDGGMEFGILDGGGHLRHCHRHTPYPQHHPPPGPGHGGGKQATAQVRTILNDIQKATNAAVMATEQGSKAVEAGERQSADAGESIRLLADSIAKSASASTQIAASSQQQMVGMDQVALAMENIKEASTLSVTSTQQAEQSPQNLHELGQRLKQLVEQYRV